MILWYNLSMTVKFLLRLPRELYDQLKEIARGSERSLNGQIVHILKEWVRKRNAV